MAMDLLLWNENLLLSKIEPGGAVENEEAAVDVVVYSCEVVEDDSDNGEALLIKWSGTIEDERGFGACGDGACCCSLVLCNGVSDDEN